MDDLSQTLDMVHDALLAGKFDLLPGLTDSIARLAQSVDVRTEQEAALLRRKASRNATSLAAALQGVRAAHRRLADLREAATGHRTYGPAGQRTAIATVPSALRQRV
jgi:hypothetical protein